MRVTDTYSIGKVKRALQSEQFLQNDVDDAAVAEDRHGGVVVRCRDYLVDRTEDSRTEGVAVHRLGEPAGFDARIGFRRPLQDLVHRDVVRLLVVVFRQTLALGDRKAQYPRYRGCGLECALLRAAEESGDPVRRQCCGQP